MNEKGKILILGILIGCILVMGTLLIALQGYTVGYAVCQEDYLNEDNEENGEVLEQVFEDGGMNLTVCFNGTANCTTIY